MPRRDVRALRAGLGACPHAAVRRRKEGGVMDESPIIVEVRRIRHKIAEECGYDLRKIAEHARKSAKEFLACKPSLSSERAFAI